MGNKKEDPIPVEEDEVYEVEALVGHRRSAHNKNHVEYLIKWKDYGHESNSWEKENNVFSKGLVLEYWSKQPYSLASFRNGTHDNKKYPPSPTPPKSNKSSASTSPQMTPKKRPTPSAAMLEMEKRRKLDDIQAAQLTAEPPVGLTWQDIWVIENVFHCGSSTYFAEVKWTRPDSVSYIPTRILRRFNPLKLIEFYEKNTDFRPLTQ